MCEFAIDGRCSLGRFGGVLSTSGCSSCIAKGKNTENFEASKEIPTPARKPIIRKPIERKEFKPKTLMEIEGPKLWSILHQRHLECDLSKEKVWLTVVFTKLVTCGECRNHWASMISKNPPRLSSRAEYYKWTVEVHNQVNERLGKPLFIPPST